MSKTKLSKTEAYFSITQEERDKIPAEDFAGPDQTYPIRNQDDLDSAAKLIGHADNPDAVKAKAIKIAKRKGLTLPDAWQEDTSKAKMGKFSSDLSQNEISDLLNRAINKGSAGGLQSTNDGYWIRDIYSDYFIYSDWSTGKLYRRPYLIDDDSQDVTLGKATEVVEKTEYEPVAKTSIFKLDAAPTVEFSNDQEYVIKRGKIFEAGNFPDKQFEITPEELKAAVADFKPVPVDDSHNSRSIFKDKWGELRSVEVKNDKELWGEVAIPKWVDTALGGAAQAVSCTWNTLTKRLAGLALENQPRIPDAAIFTHFLAEFEGKRHNSGDYQTIQDIHDATARLGANCSAQDTNNFTITDNPNKETQTMSDTTNNTQPPKAVDTADIEAKFAAMKAEIDQERQRNLALSAKLRKGEAKSAYDELKLANKLVPAQEKAFLALFEQAALDDEKDGKPEGLAIFGESGTQTNRVNGLKALFASFAPHSLTAEQVRVQQGENGQNIVVKDEDGKADFGQDTKPMDKARYEKLMSHTTVGQTALKGGN